MTDSLGLVSQVREGTFFEVREISPPPRPPVPLPNGQKILAEGSKTIFHRLSISDYFLLPLVGGGGVAELGLKGQMEQSISDFPGIFFSELGD